MGERKDIDRLFQEKFKDFEKSPGPEMWTRIERELNEEQKRRFIPIWWKLGGVAALLLLFLAIGFNWNNASEEAPLHSPAVVDTDKKTETTPETTPLEQPASKASTSDAVVSKDSQRNEEKLPVETSTPLTRSTPPKTATPVTLTRLERTQTGMGDGSSSPTYREGEHTVDLAAVGYKTYAPMVKADISRPESLLANEGPVYDGQSIEEAIAEAEALEMPTEDKPSGRWSLTPVIAPVYSTALGEGSTIHSQFNENSKSSDITMSYGVSGSYSIGKRLKIRAGVNRVDFSNSTNDVLAFETGDVVSQSNTSGIDNISQSRSTNVLLFSGTTMDRSSAPAPINAMQRADMILDYGFIEVPLALEYRMLDRRFGVNVVGGFSTFFLNNNQLSVDLNESRTVIGEANNINSTSYSANLGLGFDYSISKNLNVMLEPTFKYQINTFSNTFGNLQPYFIGVYTGLSFRF
jgi:hypothetical protein